MKNGMFIGMAIGLVAGACIVNNSPKAREVVSGAQEQIKEKFAKSQCPAQCDEQPQQASQQSAED